MAGVGVVVQLDNQSISQSLFLQHFSYINVTQSDSHNENSENNAYIQY